MAKKEPPAGTPGETRTTVAFIDLASYTPLTAAMGDQAAADVLRRFAAMVRSCTATHNGRIIKQSWLGRLTGYLALPSATSRRFRPLSDVSAARVRRAL